VVAGESSSTQGYKEEGWGGKDNRRLDLRKTVRAELKRTDYPVRRRDGGTGKGREALGKNEKSRGEKGGAKTYSRRYPCYGEVRRREGVEERDGA